MKIIIKPEYDLWAPIELDNNDFDDVMDLRRLIKGADMANSLFQITANMRKSLEWWIEAEERTAEETLDEVFRLIWEQLESDGVNPDDLIM